jgi:type IV secretion system protein VirB9
MTISSIRCRGRCLLACLAVTPLLTTAARAAPAEAPVAQTQRPVEIVTVPVPFPLPGQLKPLPRERSESAPSSPKESVTRANAAARLQPERSAWLNAIQQYPYTDGALYQIYAAPGQVTDIMLQEGEELVGTGPVAAGDTVRWIIGDTVSGAGGARRVHILVKPTRPDLVSNLVINTDRRTYHLELRATPATYMAAVSWVYPRDQLIALRATNADAAKAMPVAGGIDPATLDFRYRIVGDRPAWRPVRAFDDGRQAYIEFPQDIGTTDMPPLFVLDSDGKAELVNYRIQGRYIVVDRLFGAAELRLGTKKSEQRVRISRDNAGRRERGRL